MITFSAIARKLITVVRSRGSWRVQAPGVRGMALVRGTRKTRADAEKFCKLCRRHFVAMLRAAARERKA